MVILGVDPGYAIVGWGVLEYRGGRFGTVDFGAVTTEAGTPFEERLRLIYEQMSEIMTHYHPDALSMEQLFFNTNATTGIGVAEARGCILLAAAQQKIPVYEYTPPQVKQAVTGTGRAPKSQVMFMTRSLLGLRETPKPDDTADALAMAICHGYSSDSLLTRLKGR